MRRMDFPIKNQKVRNIIKWYILLSTAPKMICHFYFYCSTSQQNFFCAEIQVPKDQKETDLVGRPLVHASAFKQATGEAIYCDDIPQFSEELYLATVLSTRAHAKILNIDASKALSLEGVVAFYSAKDIPDDHRYHGPIFHDEEVFASREVGKYKQHFVIHTKWWQRSSNVKQDKVHSNLHRLSH